MKAATTGSIISQKFLQHVTLATAGVKGIEVAQCRQREREAATIQQFPYEPNFVQPRFSSKVKLDRPSSPTIMFDELEESFQVLDLKLGDEEDEVRSEDSSVSCPSYLEATWPEIASAVGSEVMDGFRARPISDSEFNGAKSTLLSRKDAMRRLVPGPLRPLDDKMMDSLFSNVANILQDASIMEALHQNIEAEKKPRAGSDDSSIEPMCPPMYFQVANDAESSWEELVEKYRCAVCQDVLAAPHLLNCTHTFCYGCLEDANKVISGDASLSACCSTCKSIVTSETFERHYDATICEEVEKQPDSDYKRDWAERRRRYFYAMEQAKAANNAKENQEDEYDSWEAGLIWTTTTAVAVAVVFLIVAYRNK